MSCMDPQIRRAAEVQARRSAPDRPNKKRRVGDVDDTEEAAYVEIKRYEYSGADSLLHGGKGFVVLCGFRRCRARRMYLLLCSHSLVIHGLLIP